MDYKKIISLVKEAGKIAKDKELLSQVSSKTDSDFVTAVDISISDFLKTGLAKITPEIGFMSEEEECEIQPVRWILDPIDGTTNLLYGYNMSSVSLGLCDNNKILFGVVYNPFTKELFTAVREKGAYRNGKKMKPAEDRELKSCLIEFGAGVSRKNHTEANFEIAKDVFMHCLDIRRVCSTALTLCYIADGRLNGYFERALKPWDSAAGSLILEECGGVNTDWNGKPIDFSRPSTYIAGTPKAAAFLLETIQKHEAKKQ